MAEGMEAGEAGATEVPGEAAEMAEAAGCMLDEILDGGVDARVQHNSLPRHHPTTREVSRPP
jgi:hypothetical protein